MDIVARIAKQVLKRVDSEAVLELNAAHQLVCCIIKVSSGASYRLRMLSKLRQQRTYIP